MFDIYVYTLCGKTLKRFPKFLDLCLPLKNGTKFCIYHAHLKHAVKLNSLYQQACEIYNDEFNLQVAIQPLRDGTDLRDNVQITLAEFKETCGLSPIANIKQCFRLMGTRLSNSTEQANLTLIMRGEVSQVNRGQSFS